MSKRVQIVIFPPISRSVGGCFYVGNKYMTTTFENACRLLLKVHKLKGEKL